jgi:MFS family permease
MLASAASTTIWGKLSDIWGRKPLLLTAAAIFFVGSALCGAAVSIEMLITGRAVQGLGSGGLLTLVNIIISDLFSMRNRGKYYGFIGMTWAFASGIGPVVGGALAQNVSWRWCFYINLPISGTTFIILLTQLKLETPKTKVGDGLRAIDWAGAVSISGSSIMFLMGLDFGGVVKPWASAEVLCLIIFGVVGFGLFFLNEWKLAKYPITPLRILNNGPNIAALSIPFLHGMIFIGGSFFIPLYFQATLGATVIESGIWTLPFALSIATSSAATGIYIKKTGRYLDCIRFAAFFTALGFGLFIDFPEHRSWPRIILFQIIAGIGIGPNFQSPLIALQNNVAPQDMATMTATFAFVRTLAMSIGLVVGNVIFQNGMEQKGQALAAALGDSAAKMFSGAAAGANVLVVRTFPAAQRVVLQKAFQESIRDIWYWSVGLAACLIIATAFVPFKPLRTQHTVIKTGLDVEEQRRQDLIEENRQAQLAKEVGVGKETV